MLAFFREIVLPSADKKLELSVQESTSQGCRNPHTTEIAKMGFWPKKKLGQAIEFSDIDVQYHLIYC